MFTATEILPNVYYLKFDTRIEMNKSLGRIQEYSENPKLCNTVFSTSRLKKYYKSATGNGRMCYWKYVLGCNIPGAAFQGFAREFSAWTGRELEVMRFVKNLEGAYYIIATAASDDKLGAAGALDHEIAHALYYTNPDYATRVDQIMLCIPPATRERLLERIQHSVAYAEHVVWDETHAYLATDTYDKICYRLNITREDDKKNIRLAQEALAELLKKFSGGNS